MKKLACLVICIVSIMLLSACGEICADSEDSSEGYVYSETPSTESQSVYISWEPNYDKIVIGENNATLALEGTISGAYITDITTIGITLYDADGNEIGSKSKAASFSKNDTTFYIMSDINSSLNVTLSSNTKYMFTMYAVIEGNTYTSGTYSFTTDSPIVNEGYGAAEPTPVETPLPPESTAYIPPLLNGMEQNGTYMLKLYESGKQEISDGTLVSADLMVPSTVTDEEAQSILATDPGACYYNDGNYEEICYSGGFLTRSAGESLWQKKYPSDALEYETITSGKVFIPNNAQFFDNMTSIMLGSTRNVSRLDELFHVSFMGMEFNYSSIEVQVTVSDGVINTVDMYYTP